MVELVSTSVARVHSDSKVYHHKSKLELVNIVHKGNNLIIISNIVEENSPCVCVYLSLKCNAI